MLVTDIKSLFINVFLSLCAVPAGSVFLYVYVTHIYSHRWCRRERRFSSGNSFYFMEETYRPRKHTYLLMIDSQTLTHSCTNAPVWTSQNTFGWWLFEIRGNLWFMIRHLIKISQRSARICKCVICIPSSDVYLSIGKSAWHMKACGHIGIKNGWFRKWN